MLSLIKDTLRPLYRYASSRNYRTCQSLFSRYEKYPRFQPTQIKFLDYTIEVPDALSFIHQYKEIFADESYKFIASTKKPVIYDCGANVGTSSLYFKELYPESLVYAFEADPQIYQYLEKNLERNGIARGVNIQNKAVWINDRGVTFSGDGADGGSIVSAGKNVKTIPSVRLRDLVQSEQHIDLLKLDIEGAEAEVLQDCDGNLKNVDRLFFEYHSFTGQPQVLSDLLTMLRANQFRYFIQSVQSVKSPFIHESHERMDLQLNIYCKK